MARMHSRSFPRIALRILKRKRGSSGRNQLDPRFRGGDDKEERHSRGGGNPGAEAHWTPAFAVVT